MALTLRQLRYFVCIVEAGSLAGAAQRLNVAPTALSLQVRAMEEALGVALLERHSRGVRATVEGVDLEQRARHILALMDEAEHRVGGRGRARTRRILRVGAPPAVARVLGAEVILAVNEHFDDIELRLVEGWSGDLQDRLQHGDLDMVVGYFAESIPELSHRALFDESFVFTAAPALAPAGARIGLADALASDLVFYGARSIAWQVARAAAQRLGVTLRVHQECESIEVWRSFLVRGFGMAITPFGAIAEEFHRGTLAVREIVCGAVGQSCNAGLAGASPMPLCGRLSLAVRGEPGAMPAGFVDFMADHVTSRYMLLGPFYRPFASGHPLLSLIGEVHRDSSS